MEETVNQSVESAENVENAEYTVDFVGIVRLTGVNEEGRIVAELDDGTTAEFALMPDGGMGVYHGADVAMMAPTYENGVLTGFERYREEATA